jgi:hypothetical protein
LEEWIDLMERLDFNLGDGHEENARDSWVLVECLSDVLNACVLFTFIFCDGVIGIRFPALDLVGGLQLPRCWAVFLDLVIFNIILINE